MADLKLKDLRYLVALADTRHFGRAAERCFVSQPTLSAQLKKLEDYLGVQLIERAPKRVHAHGGRRGDRRARAPHPRSRATRCVALARAAIAIRSPGVSRSRCCRPSAPICCRMSRATIRKALPRLELMLYEYQTDADAGEAAFGRDRRRNPGAAGGGGRARHLRALQRTLHGGHAGRPPAGASRQHQVERPQRRDLAAARRRPLPARPGARSLQRAPKCTRSRTSAPPASRRCGRWWRAGVGITLLPELAGRGAYGNARGVAIKPFVKPVPTRTVGAVWRKSSARREAILALCKLIGSHAL